MLTNITENDRMNKWFVILGSEKNILTEKHVLRLRLLSTVLHCFFSMLRAGVSLSLCPQRKKIAMQHSRIYGYTGLR